MEFWQSSVNRDTRTNAVSAFAPGRIEVLGNHTDYNDGLVLSAAIDRGLTVTGTGRDDDLIRLSSDLLGKVELTLHDRASQSGPTWATYVLGVARELVELGVSIGGFEMKIAATLPPRSGLASSAALEVATALFLLKLQQQTLQPMEIANLCRRAEQRSAGVQSGLLDQVTSLCGLANHLVYFDSRAESIQLIPFPSDLAFIVAQSGKQRELWRGDYNLRREQTAVAAHALGVRALREVSSRALKKRTDLDPLLSRRACHIVGENERVDQAVQALKTNDANKLGQLMNQSHESSRHNFENTTPELDLVVDLARTLPGVLGARLTGAGFGGAALALCRRSQAQEAVRQLRDAYHKKIGINAEMFICSIGDGARPIR
jgi:galactokinase